MIITSSPRGGRGLCFKWLLEITKLFHTHTGRSNSSGPPINYTRFGFFKAVFYMPALPASDCFYCFLIIFIVFSWNVHTFLTFTWDNKTCKAQKAFSYSYRVSKIIRSPYNIFFFYIPTIPSHGRWPCEPTKRDVHCGGHRETFFFVLPVPPPLTFSEDINYY